MQTGERTLTQGPLARQILFFSLPLVLSNLLQVLFNMSDVAVVGRFAGSAALGSVGSTTILVTLFTGFLIGLGGGVSVLTARFYGAQHPQDVSETVHSALLVCLAAGAALLAIGTAFSPWMLRLMGTKEDLIGGAILYLRIYFLGMPALGVYNFGSAVFSAVGDTRRPLVYLSIAGGLNIALNLLFVIVFRMGVAGVALASIISQYLSAGLVLRALVGSRACYAVRRSALRPHADKVRAIVALGGPAGLQIAIFAMANLFIQAGVNSFDTVVVRGNAAAANADALVYDVMAAFYTACASFMSQNFGAGRPERVRRSYFISLGYSFGVGLALGLGLVFFGRGFLALFTPEAAGARDAAPHRHGPVLPGVGLYGLHHRGLPRAGADGRPDRDRDTRLLRVPGRVGVHGLCLVPHDTVPLPALRLLVEPHGGSRDRILCPYL